MSIPSLVQDLFLAALPAGGQRAARRNAWAAMSADAVRARGRREAEAAVALAAAAAPAALVAAHPERRSGTGS